MAGLTSIFLIQNPSSAAEILNAAKGKIISLFGWVTSGENSIKSNIDDKLSLIFDEAEGTITAKSQGTDEAISLLEPLTVNMETSGKYFLNYVKAQHGRSFAFGISTVEGDPNLSILIANDITSLGTGISYRQAAFCLDNKNATEDIDKILYVFNGRELTYGDIAKTCYSTFLFDGEDVGTCFVRLPNVYNDCFFEDVYCLASSPLNKAGIQSGSFYINGNYYKGITAKDVGVGPFAMLV